MKIWDASCTSCEVQGNSGAIVQVKKDAFLVQTGDGVLEVRELQIPGKKRMDAGAFLRGYQVKEGELLG